MEMIRARISAPLFGRRVHLAIPTAGLLREGRRCFILVLIVIVQILVLGGLVRITVLGSICVHLSPDACRVCLSLGLDGVFVRLFHQAIRTRLARLPTRAHESIL